MSNVVTGIAKVRKVGSPTRKAVLMYMADSASDDGTGIWTSKGNMALNLEMGKRTVQKCIEDLIESGLIFEVGKRACKHGYTVEYSINLDALKALDLTGAGRAPVQDVHGRGAGGAPVGVQEVHPNHTRNHTGTTLSPLNPPKGEIPPKKSKSEIRDSEVLEILSKAIPTEAASEWIAYRKEIKKSLTPISARKQAKALSEFPMPQRIAAIDTSIQNQWTGIFPRKVEHEPRTLGSEAASIERENEIINGAIQLYHARRTTG